jgi:hypothetical protein
LAAIGPDVGEGLTVSGEPGKIVGVGVDSIPQPPSTNVKTSKNIDESRDLFMLLPPEGSFTISQAQIAYRKQITE